MIEYWCARELQLVANLFRITQTESKLKRDNISTEKEANKTHYNIGKNIKEVIAKKWWNYARIFTNTEKEFKRIRKRKEEKLSKIIIIKKRVVCKLPVLASIGKQLSYFKFIFSNKIY